MAPKIFDLTLISLEFELEEAFKGQQPVEVRGQIQPQDQFLGEDQPWLLTESDHFQGRAQLLLGVVK